MKYVVKNKNNLVKRNINRKKKIIQAESRVLDDQNKLKHKCVDF